MRLLVTGGCGFVGSNFVRYVLQHYGPEMITNVDSLVSGGLASVEGIAQEFGERYEFLRAEVGDSDKIDAVLSTHQYFAVVNFTGGSAGGTAGVANLLERARQHGVRRFVQVSNSGALAAAADGQGKQGAVDTLALDAFRAHAQEVVVTRSACNYGPFQAPAEFIPASIIHALRDEPLPVAGDGSTMRGWLHVDDHCSAIFAALLSGEPGTIYPLVNDLKTSDLEVAQAILEHLGKSRDLIRLNAGGSGASPGISDEEHLAFQQLEWKPRQHFAPALRETIDWYVRNREWWDGEDEEAERIAL
ncbi:MAG: NAD-dependent epimerase/dehydratase family protein [Chthoniobacter sp.]|uniref:NAD-dependent epimerase/dehydratase family protein n=1 Tax=Chthoniobacter sp. TaxID=2510640 RepID=UPI0032AB66D7